MTIVLHTCIKKFSCLFFLFFVTQSFVFANSFNNNDNISFSSQELEKLGASTVQESLKMIQQLQNNQDIANAQLVYEGDLITAKEQGRIEDVLASLSLNDIDRIEVDKEGNQIRYHLSKSLTKEGITALFSFTLIDEKTLSTALDPVVSIATNTPTKRSQLGDVIRVITASELETLGVYDVQSALRLLGNVSIDNAGGLVGIRMRGFAVGNTKVLYYGIDLKDPISVDGTPAFNFIPIDDVDRIEVVSGSSTIANGTGASAGVINIVTKQHTGKGYVASKVSHQQYYSMVKSNVSLGGNDVYALATFAYNDTQSSLKNMVENDLSATELLTLGFNSNKKWGRLSGSVSMINAKQELDDFSADDTDHTSNLSRQLADISYNQTFFNKLDSTLRFGGTFLKRNVHDPDGDPTTDTKTRHNGSLYSIDLYNQLAFGKNNVLVFGGEFNEERGKSSGYNWGSIDMSEKIQRTVAGYSQILYNSPWISSQLGYRLDAYRKNSGYHIKPTYHGSLFRVIPVVNILVTGTVKTGFKLPTLYQKYKPVNGNKNLTAEESFTKEISFSKKINDLEFSSTFFQSDINNKIVWDDKGTPWPNSSDDRYENLNQSDYSGVEYAVQLYDWSIVDFIRADYTILDAIDDGLPAKKVPDYKFSFSSGISYKKWTYGLYLIGEGERADASSTMGAYSYTDVSAHYQYDSTTTLFVIINNIFNKDYETAAGYNEPERTVFIGLKKQF